MDKGKALRDIIAETLATTNCAVNCKIEYQNCADCEYLNPKTDKILSSTKAHYEAEIRGII